jgi:EAL domain-containing protein (putative c-di-GMP-specific phosphodiesterase class I)
MNRILLVDDDFGVRKAILRTLHSRHRVTECADADAAFRAAERESFDIALVDFRLGAGLDGLEVLHRIMRMQPCCARLLMTADPDIDVLRHGFNAGAVQQFVAKPFKVNGLEEAIGRAVEFHRNTPLGRRSHFRELWGQCVDQGLLRLAVQPIVHASPGYDVFAYECLLRSGHVELTTPKQVIDAVVGADCVFEMGAAVNRMAAAMAVELPGAAALFVNVHPRQFADPDLLRQFEPLLEHAERIVLEITETDNLESIPSWETAVATLKRAGFRFAADDVGAGWNGLKLLAMIQASFIKVDMSMVRNIHLEARKQRLVEMLSRFAASDGALLVAEGVESPDEAATLAACGAHLLQGFYFGRPSLELPFYLRNLH